MVPIVFRAVTLLSTLLAVVAPPPTLTQPDPAPPRHRDPIGPPEPLPGWPRSLPDRPSAPLPDLDAPCDYYNFPPPRPDRYINCDNYPHVQRNVHRITVGDVQTVVVKGGWYRQSACNCRLVRCGTPMNVCLPPAHTTEKGVETCWTVGGSVSVEGETGLLVEIFAKLGVTVQLTGTIGQCYTHSEAFQFYVPVNDCFHTAARAVWTESSVSGTVDQIQEVYTWTCSIVDADGTTVIGTEYYETECNVVTSIGRADTTNGITVQIAPYTVECGGPPPQSPDPFDGETQQKCCPTVCGGEPLCCGYHADNHVHPRR